MTVAALQPAIRSADRIGQGTAVEQTRAVAEVQAAIVVAQQCPRDIDRAVRDMQRSCAQKSLAERAFFRYSRAGSQITGPSVQLARELARCFGNVQYGLVELRRDDAYSQSEMLAFAWDVQTNTRSSTTFIVPHIRDTRDGAKTLTDMRDIYENNANNGARRLREMIFAILPGWYTEDAVAACYGTLEREDDGTVHERAERAIGAYAKLGVTATHLEQKLGAPRPKWTPYDIAQLQVIHRSLLRGETRIEDEFPATAGGGRVTAAEITGNGDGHTPEGDAAANPEPRQPASANAADVRVFDRHFARLGFEEHEREEWVASVGALGGVPGLTDIAALTPEQAQQAQKHLRPQACPDRAALAEKVARLSDRTEQGMLGSGGAP